MVSLDFLEDKPLKRVIDFSISSFLAHANNLSVNPFSKLLNPELSNET